MCDASFLVKPVGEDGYIRDIFKIVRDNGVDLLVPTVGLDLGVWPKIVPNLRHWAARCWFQSLRLLPFARTSLKTFKFLKNNGFDSPETIEIRQALKRRDLKYPLFLKPWDGYASRGNAVVPKPAGTCVFGKRIPNCIVQEYIKGTEFTCDVFVDFCKKVRCVVPRMRVRPAAVK